MRVEISSSFIFGRAMCFHSTQGYNGTNGLNGVNGTNGMHPGWAIGFDAHMSLP